MQKKEVKKVKKLQLHAETLAHVAAGAQFRGGESEVSSPGCTVLTTCSPGCCNTVEV